jgi:hypothetical protein
MRPRAPRWPRAGPGAESCANEFPAGGRLQALICRRFVISTLMSGSRQAPRKRAGEAAAERGRVAADLEIARQASREFR